MAHKHTHTQQQPLMVFTEVLSKKEDFLVVQHNFLFRVREPAPSQPIDSIVELVVHAKKADTTARQGGPKGLRSRQKQ